MPMNDALTSRSSRRKSFLSRMNAVSRLWLWLNTLLSPQTNLNDVRCGRESGARWDTVQWSCASQNELLVKMLSVRSCKQCSRTITNSLRRSGSYKESSCSLENTRRGVSHTAHSDTERWRSVFGAFLIHVLSSASPSCETFR